MASLLSQLTRNVFSEETRRAVWLQAAPAPGRHPDHFRLDPCGALIEWSQYGNTAENGTGWEIDHIVPVSRGGADQLGNLQALHWQNNRQKGDGPDFGYCVVRWTGR